jgi:hypothetical protein
MGREVPARGLYSGCEAVECASEGGSRPGAVAQDASLR